MSSVDLLSRWGRWPAVCGLLPWLWAPSSLACAVCFGKSDSPIVQGVEVSVLFMVGLTYLLIIGGVVSFLLLRRRARRRAESAS